MTWCQLSLCALAVGAAAPWDAGAGVDRVQAASKHAQHQALATNVIGRLIERASASCVVAGRRPG